MTVQVNLQQTAEAFQQAFNDRDSTALGALYAPDATYQAGSELFQGREEIIQSYLAFFEAFPDATAEYWNMMISGEYFIVEGTVRGTHTGPLTTSKGVLDPTERQIEYPFAFIAKVNSEGLVQEDRTYVDGAIMMKQLGLD